MAHDVFIAHSSKDKVIADAVCTALERKSIRCWKAPRDILPGLEQAGAIKRAIAASRIMIHVSSSNSNTSEDVANEIALAIQSGVKVIPFKIDDISLQASRPNLLASTDRPAALNSPTEKQISILVGVVSGLLSQKPETASATSSQDVEGDDAGSNLTSADPARSGEERDDAFKQVEYTLADLMNGVPLPVDGTVHLAIELAESLQTAHHRVAHRNITPAGVVVARGGRVVSTNFEEVGASTSSGADMVYSVTSAGYVAPELWEGSPATPASDVYALGVILWEMLAGRRLFAADSVDEIRRKHLTEDPPLLTVVASGVHNLLANAAARSLAKDPATRFQDGHEFAGALKVCLNLLEGVEATPFLPESATTPSQLKEEGKNAFELGTTPAPPPKEIDEVIADLRAAYFAEPTASTPAESPLAEQQSEGRAIHLKGWPIWVACTVVLLGLLASGGIFLLVSAHGPGVVIANLLSTNSTSTLTATPMATYTPEVTTPPAAIVVPSQTSTTLDAEPVPSATALPPTATEVPNTPTPKPSLTATALPPTATIVPKSPTPLPSVSVSYPAPSLELPAQGAIFDSPSTPIILRWSLAGGLRDEKDLYLLYIHVVDAPQYDVYDFSRAQSYQVNTFLCGKSRQFEWNVVVWRQTGSEPKYGFPVGTKSETRTFTWNASIESPGGGGAPVR